MMSQDPDSDRKASADLSKRPLSWWLEQFKQLTPQQLWTLVGVVVVVLAAAFGLGFWVCQLQHPRAAAITACSPTNVRIAGHHVPPPGAVLTVDAGSLHLEWEPADCRSSVHAWYLKGEPTQVFTAELTSPAAVTLSEVGRYELKVWDTGKGKIVKSFVVERK